jgi:hypothetical protein
MFRLIHIAPLFICSIVSAQISALHEAQKLTASDGAGGDRFGIKVSISGNYALIGAYQDDDNGSNSGSAYIFEYDGTTWNETSKLLASDGEANDNFGLNVSIFGDTAMVGSPKDDDNGTNAGAVYVYRFNGTEWVQEVKLLASDGESNDNFGIRFSIVDNLAIVGANLDDDQGSNSGSVYIFRYDGSQWNEEAKLIASDGSANDHYGRSVFITDSLAIVGARLDDDMGTNSGSAYVYRFDGTHWVEEAKLLASDGSSADNFGHSTSIFEETILVGAREGGSNGCGQVYLFRFNGFEWIEETIFTPENGMYADEFGHRVSIQEDVILVGSGADDDYGQNSGSAYIFRFVNNQWTRTKLRASDGAAYDNFGLTVSLSGNKAIVGARSHDENGVDAGAAYIFEIGNLLLVDDDGTSPFDNIQSAIDAADHSDEILVLPGTYFGSGDEVVNMLGKQVWLHSRDGNEVTFINGDGIRRGITCSSKETIKTNIDGFTVTNCNSGILAAGIVCLNSMPNIQHCVIQNQSGVGMYTSWGNPTFINCTFQNNTDRGADCIGDATFIDCIFDGNSTSGPHSGAAMEISWGNPTITNCSFMNNTGSFYGGALHGEATQAIFTDCIISDNTAQTFGGGFYFESHKPTDYFPTFIDSIICNNSPNQISGFWIDGGGNIVEDECPSNCHDLTGDLVVNVSDLLFVISEWEATDSPADVTGDGVVDVADLLLLIGNWGPCL